MTPTTEQSAIYEAIAAGKNLSVNAVAGSGKSTTIAQALHHVPHPFGILLVFNKANAETLNNRGLRTNYEAKTLNGLGHGIWSTHIGRRLQVSMRKSSDILKSFNTKLSPQEFADICRVVSLAKAYCISPGVMGKAPPSKAQWQTRADEIGIEEFDYALASQVLAKSTEMAFNGFIDFDDQLYMPVMFDAAFPRIPFVGVDEAQDLSSLQHEMISRLKFKQIMVVGDPHQAIYAFRGALSSSFDTLSERFNLESLPLSQSFRCPQIVGREVVQYAPHFRCAPTNKPGTITRLDEPPARGAVLARYNAPLIRQAFVFLRKGLPVDYLGRDFLAGLRTLHAKHPTPTQLEAWLKARLIEVKTDGAKDRAKDQYASLMTLHGLGDVDQVLQKMLTQAKLGHAIVLATVHKSKGMEWNDVTFLGGQDHSPDAEGQEGNINYVALTRSANNLVLTPPTRRR
jgi:superfamily I DNA/RNA helicase